MNYPLISEYMEAIRSAEDNFEELSYLRPVLGDDGLPVMTSGNFAVVFKMKDEQSRKFYAVKCFTKELEGRAEAYRKIVKELENVSSPYILSIRYLDKELFVDTDQTNETEFPVLLMDWVEGKTLDKYLRENLDDKFVLEMLAYRFSQLAQWLIPQPFAHGDLKPDNILVREDVTLVLVDYDGMYVPTMKGQKARELGSPNFRHPQRTEDDFDDHIDDFPLASILLSLKAISIKPQLLEEYGEMDRLLLSEADYRDISSSKLVHVMQYLLSIKEFADTYSVFITALTCFGMKKGLGNTFNDIHYNFSFSKMLLETKVNASEKVDCIKDDNDVEYSKDGKRLIKGYIIWDTYEIKNGTETICDDAFSGKNSSDGSGSNYVEKIVIPDSVKNIGRNPFAFCYPHVTCNSPNFIFEDNVLYTLDRKLLIGYYGNYDIDKVNIPEGVETIGDYAFAGSWWLKTIKLPFTLSRIGDNAFLGCHNLEKVEIQDNLRYIGNSAFEDCWKLNEINLPKGLMSIGNFAFSWCGSIQSVTIPSTVLSIGINPFIYDRYLEISSDSFLFEVENKTLYTKGKRLIISCLSQEKTFQIPVEVTHIGQQAFWGCPFKSLFIHDNINYIGKDAFDGCSYEEFSYRGFSYGYTINILVSKGRYDWARKRIKESIFIKEIDNV